MRKNKTIDPKLQEWADKHLMFALDRDAVELPPENIGKVFGKVDANSLEGINDYMKVLVQIYKHNMTKKPIWFSKIRDMFDGTMASGMVARVLGTLQFSSEVLFRTYGETTKGRAGALYFIRHGVLQEVREVYENSVSPRERPEDRISYVPALAYVLSMYT